MGEGAPAHEGGPTLLKELLRQRYQQPYRRFCEEYDKVARRLDRRLVGTYPSPSTYKRWLSGKLSGIPRSEPCIVLEAMFPGHTVAELFEPYRGGGGDVPEHAQHLDVEQPTATHHGARVDPALIEYFQQQISGHYRADMMLGPRALIGTVSAQCRLIGDLVDNADGSTRLGMARVGAEFATFAAWLHLDAGDAAASLRWHDVAQELAHRSRDAGAVACALVDRAMARTDLGAGAAVVDLCAAALTSTALPAELHVFGLQQQAHGASLLGDRGEVDRLLDESARQLDRVDEEQWGTSCLRTPAYVEVQRATCYGRLGLASEAERAWEQIIPAAPSTSRRDVGVWVARQATAAATLCEPERAVELSRHAVEIAVDTGSVRARRELAAVDRAMSPWHADRVGQDLAEALAPISGRE